MFAKKSIFRFFILLFATLLISGTASASPLKAPLGTGFTYQGRLLDGGVPANGTYDLEFTLFDALSGGSQVGSTLTQGSVIVTNGLFTVQLDFGAVFDGTALYLEIGVRPGGTSGSYTTLAPRQSLSAGPYALYATQAGSVPWSGLTGVPSAWGLTGNAGTNPTTNYIGTSDNQPLELHVNGQRGLRLEPSAGTPNLLGGYSGNSITSGVIGATISGGGENGSSNRVTDYYGTIGGGTANQAGDNAGNVYDAIYATVGGGNNNAASGNFATVGGGCNNTAGAEDATVGGGCGNMAIVNDATVGGGNNNKATKTYATVDGGLSNTASGLYAMVSGGTNNTAGGNNSFAAGTGAKATQLGAFVWADSNSHTYDPFSYSEVGGVYNSFNVRATGGVYFVSAFNSSTGEPTAGVWLGTGGSGWNAYSDPSFKQNIKPIDNQEILTRLAAVPINSWNYKSQDASIKHIGPMAPAFNAAFGVGEPDKTGALKYINSLDADGVALASIQALYQRSQEQASQIQALKDQLVKVEKAGGSSPSNSQQGMWIILSGFLGLLVVFQAISFFTLRRRSG